VQSGRWLFCMLKVTRRVIGHLSQVFAILFDAFKNLTACLQDQLHKTIPTYIRRRDCTLAASGKQGCQMVCFQTNKIPIWVNFGRPRKGKRFVYSLTIWNIIRPFGAFYGNWVI
jgi:hypothetical protein